MNGIRATPAGSEMNVRTIGSIRDQNTTALPCRSNQRSAIAIRCGVTCTYLPHRSMNPRPPV